MHEQMGHSDPEPMLPDKVVGRDWDGELQWEYETKSIDTTVQLTDKDFSPDNPRYRYPDGVVDLCFRLPWPFGGK